QVECLVGHRYYLDLRVPEVLGEVFEPSFIGVAVHPHQHRFPLDDEDIAPLDYCPIPPQRRYCRTSPTDVHQPRSLWMAVGIRETPEEQSVPDRDTWVAGEYLTERCRLGVRRQHLDPVKPQEAEELALLLDDALAENRTGLWVLLEELRLNESAVVFHRDVDG